MPVLASLVLVSGLGGIDHERQPPLAESGAEPLADRGADGGLEQVEGCVAEPVLKREHWRSRAQPLALLMQRTEMLAESGVEILQDLDGTPALGILHVSPTPSEFARALS